MTLDEILKPISIELIEFETTLTSMCVSEVDLILEVISHINDKKGKRLRPSIMLLVAKALNKVPRRIFENAAMLEILHTGSLIHDDIVDNAEQRRGVPSVNAKWNNKVSVLMGDFLFSHGMQTAFENKDYDFLSTLSTVVRSMSESELLALQLSDQPLNFTEEIYYKIIFAKTASLIAAACKTSAIVSNGEPAVIEAITEYGRNVGMSFQIKDDIFDYSENSQIIGKPVGNDICEGKVTLPLIYALKIATEQEKKEIAELIRKQDISETDIKQIIEFTTKQGGIEYAMEKGRKFSQEAIKHINFLPDSDAKESLINFANYVIEREK